MSQHLIFFLIIFSLSTCIQLNSSSPVLLETSTNNGVHPVLGILGIQYLYMLFCLCLSKNSGVRLDPLCKFSDKLFYLCPPNDRPEVDSYWISQCVSGLWLGGHDSRPENLSNLKKCLTFSVVPEGLNACPTFLKPIWIWLLDCLQLLFSFSFIWTIKHSSFVEKKIKKKIRSLAQSQFSAWINTVHWSVHSKKIHRISLFDVLLHWLFWYFVTAKLCRANRNTTNL